jgi:hypothetical protein
MDDRQPASTVLTGWKDSQLKTKCWYEGFADLTGFLREFNNIH